MSTAKGTSKNFILLMGESGVGKSNFIDTLLGGPKRSGNSMKPYTTTIQEYPDDSKLKDLGFGEIVFIDTPGYDATSQSDHDATLESASDYMGKMHKNQTVSLIIYFHRITDNRPGKCPLSMRNFRTLKSLTGASGMEKIWMVTTMWDNPNFDKSTGRTRQVELETQFWKELVRQGTQSIAFHNTRETAEEILKEALTIRDLSSAKKAQKARSGLIVREELTAMKEKLQKTKEGRELYAKLDSLEQRRSAIQATLADDTPIPQPLKDELAEIEKEMEAATTLIPDLTNKIPFFRRMLHMVFKKGADAK